MDKIKIVKGFFVAAFAIINGLLGNMTAPVIIMVGCNVLDYITAIMAAPKRGRKISSAAGIKGIIKKVSMWLLVIVGALIDYLLIYAADTINISVPFTYLVACIVAIWTCFNEIISILENLTDVLGEEKMPPFLLPLVKNLKKQTQEKIKVEKGEESEK